MTGYCDAHNHLQDARFRGQQAELMAVAQTSGIERWVVNGSGEADWPAVEELARQYPGIIPSFGYHPWYLSERTQDWQSALLHRFETSPRAVVGEIGLDRWILERSRPARTRAGSPGSVAEPASLEEQSRVFGWQWRLAVERQLPVSVHCLKAWGALMENLRVWPRLDRGFLLHSYGGPAELIPELVRLGAYFGFAGYFLHERKAAQRTTFQKVPAHRLLIETDAPDQGLPDALNRFPLHDPVTGAALNHPANLVAVYSGLAEFLDRPMESLRDQVRENFRRLFGD